MSAVTDRVETSRRDYLKRLLTPLWLRPESALWYAHEAFLASKALGPMEGRSLELGSMDGTATFVMLGGEFSPEFDVYGNVKWNADSKRWSSLEDSDYYDAVKDGGAQAAIYHRPARQFDTGLVWKNAHAEKATRLGIYKNIVNCDPNGPLKALKDADYDLIWGPNVYWVDNLEGLLREAERVLKPGGKFVTVVPDRAALAIMLHNLKTEADPDWIQDLDRGRFENISRQARTLQEWKFLFANAGLKVGLHEKFLPKPVFSVNDIGLRPMFPVFMDIYETLKKGDAADLARIKKSWVDTCFHFLAPLCDVAWMERAGYPKVWHLFELSR